MKKELFFKLTELVLCIAGMIAAVVFLYRGSAVLTLSTLAFWAVAGVVFYLYRRNNKYGIIAAIIGMVLYFGGLVLFTPDAEWWTTILFGALVALAGGIVIWLGGVLGMMAAELVKFILRLLWPDKKIIANN